MLFQQKKNTPFFLFFFFIFSKIDYEPKIYVFSTKKNTKKYLKFIKFNDLYVCKKKDITKNLQCLVYKKITFDVSKKKQIKNL